jgi:hypothetical protein
LVFTLSKPIPVLPGRHFSEFGELPVKIRECFEARIHRYIRYGPVRFYQQLADRIDPVFIQKCEERFVHLLVEKPGECLFTHMHFGSNLRKRNVFGVPVPDKMVRSVRYL